MPHSLDQWMWTDARMRGVSFEAKGLYAYLVTNLKREICGLYYLPRVLIQHETGLPADRLDHRLQHLIQRRLIEVDEDRELIWVIDMLRHQGCREHLSWQQAAWIFAQVKAIENSGTPLVDHWLTHHTDWSVGPRPGTDEAPPTTPYTIGYRYPIDTLSIGVRIKKQDLKAKKLDPRAHVIAPEDARVSVTPEPPHASRSTRCPADFHITPQMLAWAEEKGFTHVLNLDEVTEAFIDYWRNRKTVRPDWPATWRNWVRTEYNRHPGVRHRQVKSLKVLPSKHDPEFDAIVARKIAEEQQEDSSRARQRTTGV